MLEIISDKDNWDRALARFSGYSETYHWAYMNAAAKLEEKGWPELAVFSLEGEVLFHPYIRRPVPDYDGCYDLMSVFEFGGFWSSTSDNNKQEALLAAFGKEFPAYCREQKIVCEFVRLDPFSIQNLEATNLYDVRFSGINILIELYQDHAENWDRYRYSRQKQIKQGRDKYKLRISESKDYSLLAHTAGTNLRRKNAPEFYIFPASFFEAIGDFLTIFEVRTEVGDLCAMHCYLRDNDVVYAFLCHGVYEYLPYRPNDFAYDYAIRYFAEKGFKHLHLGGGPEQITAYKSSFGPGKVDFSVAKAIFDQDLYSELVRLSEADQNSSFFPLYRAKTLKKDYHS